MKFDVATFEMLRGATRRNADQDRFDADLVDSRLARRHAQRRPCIHLDPIIRSSGTLVRERSCVVELYSATAELERQADSVLPLSYVSHTGPLNQQELTASVLIEGGRCMSHKRFLPPPSLFVLSRIVIYVADHMKTHSGIAV